MTDNSVRLAILGSTGALGETVLSVVRSFPDKLNVVGLGAGTNVDLLAQQIQEFEPFMAHIGKGRWQDSNIDLKDFRFVTDQEMVNHQEVDTVVVASVGKVGLEPTLGALRSGKRVALGNQETMAMAGSLLTDVASKQGSEILPLNAETSAIWQLLKGETSPISRLILTSSYGPARPREAGQVPSMTPEEIAVHVGRRMGRKRSIDATTLMSKAVQVLEAHYLFNIPLDAITVVYHPENIIRAIVEFEDGSSKAHFAPSDPRLAVQTVLLFPERLENELVLRLSLTTAGQLTLRPLDESDFPLFGLAIAAARAGNTYPAVISAANESAVDLFLSQSIGFTDIAPLVERTLAAHQAPSHPVLEDIMDADQWAREFVSRQVAY